MAIRTLTTFSDLMVYNIMIDSKGMWPEPYHIMAPHMNRSFTARVKKPFTRTARPPKYHIIDFGLSRQYAPDNLNPTETLPEGGDRTVPEFTNGTQPVLHDPFAVDIYCVGNVIQECILQVSRRTIDVFGHLLILDTCRYILVVNSFSPLSMQCENPTHRNGQRLSR